MIRVVGEDRQVEDQPPDGGEHDVRDGADEAYEHSLVAGVTELADGDRDGLRPPERRLSPRGQTGAAR